MVEHTMDIDPNKIDDVDMDEVNTNEEVDQTMTVQLVNGVNMEINMGAMNLDEIYDNQEAIESNILSCKSMIHQIVTTPFSGDTDKDLAEAVYKRDQLADEIFNTTHEYLKNIGVQEYIVPDTATPSEKAMMVNFDAIIISEAILSFVRMWHMYYMKMPSLKDFMVNLADGYDQFMNAADEITANDPIVERSEEE